MTYLSKEFFYRAVIMKKKAPKDLIYDNGVIDLFNTLMKVDTDNAQKL
jgi:hypothetical protein